MNQSNIPLEYFITKIFCIPKMNCKSYLGGLNILVTVSFYTVQRLATNHYIFLPFSSISFLEVIYLGNVWS